MKTLSFLSRVPLFFSLFLLSFSAAGQSIYNTASPNGRLKVEVVIGKNDLSYRILHDGQEMVSLSPISMTLSGSVSYGANPKLKKQTTRNIDSYISAPLYKRSSIKDNYNELTLEFHGEYNVIFRAYDEGIAYRFISLSEKPFVVTNEQAVFNFPQDNNAWVPYVRDKGTFEEQKFNSFENKYEFVPLAQWDDEKIAFLPLLIDAPNGKKICITEADLLNYPGMFLYNGSGEPSLTGFFAEYPATIEQGGYNNLQGMVTSREDYIAKFEKGTSFPWRVIIVSEKDSDLVDSDMVYKLASPSSTEDWSWVEPGKVAWDWWNHWNLFGVDFKTGINNETYKYYIDFASQRGIEYIILDEGWAVTGKADLFDIIDGIDLPMLIGYAAERNVGIILWAGYWAFDRDMERICEHYSQMGVKGFKVDFMDRDDQLMVDFHRRCAEVAARHKLLIDFHGTYKPTGLQRTYPNAINFEGVNGLEQMKWSPPQLDQVTYDVTIPFIRMVAGPLDYTQGAMRNASKGNYAPINTEAMSQGTRCRQLGQYVIFESPLSMLCDSPSNYLMEEECLGFITGIPTVWDETIALGGEVSEYVVIARRSGSDWYVGGLTNWDSREFKLDLSFLGDGHYVSVVFRDGVNADKVGRDYRKETISIPSDRQMTIKAAPGGGFAMKIFKL